MVFGLDKAPDQIKGSYHIVDTLLLHGRKINKAAMTLLLPRRSDNSTKSDNIGKEIYSLAQASLNIFWYYMLY